MNIYPLKLVSNVVLAWRNSMGEISENNEEVKNINPFPTVENGALFQADYWLIFGRSLGVSV